MSASTTKKVVVERFDREPLRGFVQQDTYLQAAAAEFLLPDGTLVSIPYEQIKAVCFVRDLQGPSVLTERRTFLARPKSPGLWVVVRFRDGDELEGILPNSLLQLESAGFTLSPPEAAGNTQRVFVPRQSVREVTVAGVVGSLKRRKKSAAGSDRQIRLFSEP